VRSARCDRHKKERNAVAQRQRGNDPFLNSRKWQRLRLYYLARNPLCADCNERGRSEPATEVHHVIKRSIAPQLAMDPMNLQGLCKACHSSRTARGE